VKFKGLDKPESGLSLFLPYLVFFSSIPGFALEGPVDCPSLRLHDFL